VEILRQDLRKNIFEIKVDAPEDLLFLALFIEPEDTVYAWTTRQLKYSRGLKTERGERVKVYMGLKVTKIEYDDFREALRIHGIVTEAPDYLEAQGTHHTLTVSPGNTIKIIKNKIYKYQIELINYFKKSSIKIALISIGNQEIAISELTLAGIKIKYTIKVSTSKTQKETKLSTIYAEIIKELKKKLEVFHDKYSYIIILVDPIVNTAIDNYLQQIKKEYSKRITIQKVSEGGIAGIYEFTRSDQFKRILSTTRLYLEEQIIEKMFATLVNKPEKIAVGIAEVKKAAELGAVDTLIVLKDTLIHVNELKEIIKNIEKYNGRTVVLVARGEGYEKIKALGGAVALLRYPVQLKPP